MMKDRLNRAPCSAREKSLDDPEIKTPSGDMISKDSKKMPARVKSQSINEII
jgi:hypothetical protein